MRYLKKIQGKLQADFYGSRFLALVSFKFVCNKTNYFPPEEAKKLKTSADAIAVLTGSKVNRIASRVMMTKIMVSMAIIAVSALIDVLVMITI